MPDTKPSAVGTLAFINAGPIIWAIHLTLIYGGHTLLCTPLQMREIAGPYVLAVTAAALLALGAFLLRPHFWASACGLPPTTADRPQYDSLARLLATLGVVAVAWAGATAFFLSACVAAR
ncbi:MAG: hypothetical protein AB7O39_16070 [Flavobacteriaceae bacterium]